jgi:predicted histidine transporter YuiF (NhaC family)
MVTVVSVAPAAGEKALICGEVSVSFSFLLQELINIISAMVLKAINCLHVFMSKGVFGWRKSNKLCLPTHLTHKLNYYINEDEA